MKISIEPLKALYYRHINSQIKKLIFWCLIVILSLPFTPFIIGFSLAFLVWTKIHNKIIKSALALALIVPTLFIGCIWVSELFSLTTTKSPSPIAVTRLRISPTIVPAMSPTPKIQIETVRVIRVIDGDTIEIEGGQKIRYIGIDTPETVQSNELVVCNGVEASAKNSELVLNKLIRLEKDVSDTDQYGRLLRYIWIDNTLINEELVQEGYALASSYPPDVKYQERLNQAQREAREGSKGLWKDCQEVVPTSTPIPLVTKEPTQIPTAIPTSAAIPTIQPTAIPQAPTTVPQPVTCMYNCVSPDRDCGDFTTHQVAVDFWNCCDFTVTDDPMRLDGKYDTEDDGDPCESLP